jgi:aryl-alcohol dehydrogenase-like predicted oxidoreductase
MEKREIGNSGIKVYPFAFGGNVFGWTIDEKQSFEILDAYVDYGLDFIDTADVYSVWASSNKGGESETIIGNWLYKTKKRDQVIIATKVGMQLDVDKKGLSKKYIISAVEASLKRLQTDYLDLYQTHKDDPDTPLLETLEALDDLKKQGKIRAVGASNYSSERLEEAMKISTEHNLAKFECLQPEYNLYQREDYEKNLEPFCLENKIGVITYFSLASGFLTGKYRSENDFSKSSRGQGMKKYLNPRGFKILAALDEAAKEYNVSNATIALAWIMARKSITAPIASATNVEQLKELEIATKLKLSDETITNLNIASAY